MQWPFKLRCYRADQKRCCMQFEPNTTRDCCSHCRQHGKLTTSRDTELARHQIPLVQAGIRVLCIQSGPRMVLASADARQCCWSDDLAVKDLCLPRHLRGQRWPADLFDCTAPYAEIGTEQHTAWLMQDPSSTLQTVLHTVLSHSEQLHPAVLYCCKLRRSWLCRC